MVRAAARLQLNLGLSRNGLGLGGLGFRARKSCKGLWVLGLEFRVRGPRSGVGRGVVGENPSSGPFSSGFGVYSLGFMLQTR